MIFDTCGTCQKEASCSIVVERLLDVYAREVGCVFLLKEIKYPLTDIWYGVHFVISETNMKKKNAKFNWIFGARERSPLDNIENWPSKFTWLAYIGMYIKITFIKLRLINMVMLIVYLQLLAWSKK